MCFGMNAQKADGNTNMSVMDKAEKKAAHLRGAKETQAPLAPQDNAKCRQILEGARTVFRAKGFDGASMETIAREANVSKGTLYVYFESKEALFEALILADRHTQAESLLKFNTEHPDMITDLKSLGRRYVRLMVSQDKIATLRMVLGAAEKFPQFGRLLYEAGPVQGAIRLGAYLDTCVAAGKLKSCDTVRAAEHFFELCVASLVKRRMFGMINTVEEAEIEKTVDLAVDIFLNGYGSGKS